MQRFLLLAGRAPMQYVVYACSAVDLLDEAPHQLGPPRYGYLAAAPPHDDAAGISFDHWLSWRNAESNRPLLIHPGTDTRHEHRPDTNHERNTLRRPPGGSPLRCSVDQ